MYAMSWNCHPQYSLGSMPYRKGLLLSEDVPTYMKKRILI